MVQRLTREKNGVYSYPAIYVGTTQSEYLDLMPDESLAGSGAYSFWDVQDPVTVQNWRGVMSRATFTASLIVWGDLRLIYPADWQGRTYANVASDIMNLLKGGTGLAQFGDDFTFFHEGASIFQRFTHREIERQHMMKPYFGLRIEGQITYVGNCS